MPGYFTYKGYKNHCARIARLETEISDLEKQIADTVSAGNTFHDNAFRDHLVEDIRVADTRLNDAHNLLRGAQIIQYPPFDGRVLPGTKVTLMLNNVQETFKIVAYGELNADDEKILYESPIAEAMAGHVEGDEFIFDLRGDKRKIKILKVEPMPHE